MDIYKITIGIVVSLALCACKEARVEMKNDAALKTTTQTAVAKVKKGNEEDDFAKEKKRLKNLLSGFSSPLENQAVTLDLTGLGAKYVQGYKVKDQPIKGFAYLFSHQDEHATAYEYLTANHSNEKYHTLISSNGAWLFWTYSEVDTDETRYLIYDLVSAFSGEE
jgi:hypothetical protein